MADLAALRQLAVQLRAAYYADPMNMLLAREYRRTLVALLPQPEVRKRQPKPRGTCSECGGPMHVGPTSAPPDRRRCQDCRKARPKKPKPSTAGACLVCGGKLGPTGRVACSPHHGGLISAWKQLRPGEPFDREAMAVISAARRQRRTVRSRQRHLRRAQTWDGITDLEIFERDGWRCQVPECRYRYRTINRRYKYPDPRSPGIDHIVPLSLGGDDTCVNKRAAHHGCNMARGNRMGDEQLPLIGSIREPPLTTEIAGTVRERRPPKPPPPPKMRRCPCGKVFPPHKAGRGDRCPDCWSELAVQARAMRARSMKWQEIADALGLCGPGRAYALAVYQGSPARQPKQSIPPIWTAKARAAAARLEAEDAAERPGDACGAA